MSDTKKKEPNDQRFNMVMSKGLLERLDNYRRGLDKIPPRAETIRDLLEFALREKSKP